MSATMCNRQKQVMLKNFKSDGTVNPLCWIDGDRGWNGLNLLLVHIENVLSNAWLYYKCVKKDQQHHLDPHLTIWKLKKILYLKKAHIFLRYQCEILHQTLFHLDDLHKKGVHKSVVTMYHLQSSQLPMRQLVLCIVVRIQTTGSISPKI